MGYVRFWGAVTVVLTVLAMAPAIQWLGSRKRRFDRCLLADGEVIGYDDSGECRCLRYRFHDRYGAHRTGTSGVGSNSFKERVGDPVRVIYDPDEPSWNDLDRWDAKYGAPALILFILAPFLLAGIALLITGKSEWHSP